MNKAYYRKINDRSLNSSKYHKKDGTAVRAILKRLAQKTIRDHSVHSEDCEGSSII